MNLPTRTLGRLLCQSLPQRFLQAQARYYLYRPRAANTLQEALSNATMVGDVVNHDPAYTAFKKQSKEPRDKGKQIAAVAPAQTQRPKSPKSNPAGPSNQQKPRVPQHNQRGPQRLYSIARYIK